MLTRLDDAIIDHDKVEEAGLKLGKQGYFVALGAVAWALCYANKKLTDGFIPARALDKYGATEALADVMVDVKLWDRVQDGYIVHDFHDWNPTASAVKDKRKRDRERKRVHAGFRAEISATSNGVGVDGTVESVTSDTAGSSHAHAGAPADQDRTGEDTPIVSKSEGGESERGMVLTMGQLQHAAIELVGLWNGGARDPFVLVGDDLGDDALRRAQRALKAHPSLDWWVNLFAEVFKSAFLAGGGDRGWVADFWWVLEHSDEIATGRYRNRQNGSIAKGKTASNDEELARFAARRTK